MQYCKKCVMPDTRPGIRFNEDGVCQACLAEEMKKTVDWDVRWHELELLCDKYRGKYGKNTFDCAIAVSGGKDSHRQVHIFKERLGMNPLCITVEDNFPMTRAGMHNIRNLSETFGCHILSLKPNIRAQKALMRTCFKKWGKPTWYLDRLIYTWPPLVTAQFGLELLVYGENVSWEYGGENMVETCSARGQMENGVACDIPSADIIGKDVAEQDLALCHVSAEVMQRLNPVYLSYFIRWNSYENYRTATRMGFHDLTHEWQREHTPECYDQIDSRAYLVHAWMKYPKFGHATGTDYAARLIRYNLITREEGKALVRKHDHKLDARSVEDFCNFTGLSLREFYDTVDTFYNKDLFIKDRFGEWVLRHPVWDDNPSVL